MQPCHLSITTATEGTERSVSYEGEAEFSALSATVRYQEESALVHICVEKGAVTIERKGDYTLALRLKESCTCEGSIGIGGANGEMYTHTHKLSYSIGKNSLLLSVRYDLLTEGEPQKIKLRLYAKTKEE